MKCPYPTIVTTNDEELTYNIVIPAIKNRTNLEINSNNLPVSASEDFSNYQKIIPGVFIMLGARDDNHKEYLHTPTYNYNDRSTIYGIQGLLAIIDERLNKNIFLSKK